MTTGMSKYPANRETGLTTKEIAVTCSSCDTEQMATVSLYGDILYYPLCHTCEKCGGIITDSTKREAPSIRHYWV